MGGPWRDLLVKYELGRRGRDAIAQWSEVITDGDLPAHPPRRKLTLT